MASDITNSILERIGHPSLVSVLSQDLSGSELNSVLLEVFNQKVQGMTPAAMLNLYQQNRFVKPADLPVVELRRIELEQLQLFEQLGFQPIDLAPVNILGSCSVVGPADQKKILSALRGTEVMADSTNAIALHVSDLRQKNPLAAGINRFSNIQRMVRTQAVAIPGFTPHFRVGSLVSCGADTGGYEFEKITLQEHISVMKKLFLDYYQVEHISFRLLRRQGYPDNFTEKVYEYLTAKHSGIQLTLVPQPEKAISYYKGIQYKIDILVKGKKYEIGDGGFVDWTQHLLQNKKERMFSTGYGFDLMYRILHNRF